MADNQQLQTKTNMTDKINPGYGYRLIDVDKEPFDPEAEVWMGRWKQTINRRGFNQSMAYRRKVNVGEGYRLVGENEVILAGDDMNSTSNPDGQGWLQAAGWWEGGRRPADASGFLIFRRKVKPCKPWHHIRESSKELPEGKHLCLSLRGKNWEIVPGDVLCSQVKHTNPAPTHWHYAAPLPEKPKEAWEMAWERCGLGHDGDGEARKNFKAGYLAAKS
jgi:hypothetical protein